MTSQSGFSLHRSASHVNGEEEVVPRAGQVLIPNGTL